MHSGRLSYSTVPPQEARGHAAGAPVLYWMHREMRARDNWALLHAQQCAAAGGAPLAVVFCLVPQFIDAGLRHFHFMLQGLEETTRILEELGIPLFLLRGTPPEEVVRFAQAHGASRVVTDFDTLRIKRQWIRSAVEAARQLDIAVDVVDSRNVVPCLRASDKREYAARTIRPKIHRLLDEYLDPLPALQPTAVPWKGAYQRPDWQAALDSLQADASVQPAGWLPPGEDAALAELTAFIRVRMHRYAAERNNPLMPVLSHLSPYLHFGMLSAQRAVLEVMQAQGTAAGGTYGEGAAAFVEELVVRRELADNFCWYEPSYDSVEAFPDWALKTLDRHRADRRPYLYDEQQLEKARTHDPLWNAAQQEMVLTGKMHGYMRMYWAKKILEWTESPEEALRIVIRQNDRWSLDGRDSNGYAGAAWSVGGVHDRPWREREVFGTIRFMSYNGARSKFDVDGYVAAVAALENHPVPAPVSRGGGRRKPAQGLLL
ncbi:deoxyribodipyrimidine photo-lyase [Oleidesulfovibrio alaskensis]|uniref:deoxyribodipyrimidine photo-lyase n=1 Tax=Oleidesulfovibrio alaskensis TaxID=58180 RepID=UPI001A402E44|nr:deoxyribodipyrimidine photo-lyase [Oleidesulfovibrio alaskensis]MBL3582802.1 deoxyribodipyrimidine photo-lyase [Oleidesulfovibrio alaskensis]